MSLPKKVIKIDNYDTTLVRGTMDDAIGEYLETEIGLIRNNKVANIKLFLGIVCVIAACIAHYFPTKHPNVRLVLMACISTYYCASYFMQWVIVERWEKGAFFFGTSKDMGNVSVASTLGLYDEFYTLTLTRLGEGKGVSRTVSIGKFFDAKGVFYPEPLYALLRDALEEFRKTHGITTKQKKKKN